MTNLIQEIDKSLHFRLPDDRIVPAVTIGNFFSGNHSLFLNSFWSFPTTIQFYKKYDSNYTYLVSGTRIR